MYSKRYSTLNAESLPIVKLRKIAFLLNFDWFDKDSIDFLYKLSFWQSLHCSMVKLALLLSASKYTCKHTHLQRDKHTQIKLVNRKRVLAGSERAAVCCFSPGSEPIEQHCMLFIKRNRRTGTWSPHCFLHPFSSRPHSASYLSAHKGTISSHMIT